ncbi:hypothetical protein OSTOST_19173 [Ostertagia ostertagi]
MTKLGITPGVHGDGTDEKSADTVTDTVKVDPKVFTVLQPTVIPIQTQPAAKPRRSIGSAILRGVLLFLLFISCFTAGMVLIYGADTIFNGIYGAIKGDQSAVATTMAPTAEQFGLVNPMGNDLKDGKPAADDEMKVFFNSIPLAKVMVIEGGNTPDVNGQQKAMNERPMHPYEQQEIPYDAYNNRPAMPPPMWVLQARQMERAQAIRQWRWRRLQQAIYEQQMMREANGESRMGTGTAEQQQRAAQEEQLARAIAQARWEQVQRARAMEEYQAEVLTRPHDASPAQILSMQQPTVPPAPEMGMHDKIYQEMQRRSQFMEFNVPSRPIWTAITPTPETPGNYDHDAIFQENLKKINEMSTTTASPMTTVKVAEIKQVEGENMFRDILSVFDEAEKKVETVPTTTESVFKGIRGQIGVYRGTAITPDTETPGNYDHDAIFQENLKKINEMSTTTASPMTTVKVAEIKQVEGENMFRDILSVFDEAEKKVETVPTTTESVFKAFEDKSASTEMPKIEKEPTKEVVDSAAQIDLPADSIFKTVEEQKPEPENVFKAVEEQKPEPENVFKTVEEQKPEEAQIPEEDSEGPVGPVVIEDRFPRIGARTTVPVESTTPVADVESDEDMEHDPLAAFLRYFEQEAQKIRGPPKTAIVDSEVRKEDPKTVGLHT